MDCPYQQYYANQAGSGIGAIYRGAPYQRGHGIGSFLGGIFRSILPLFKTGARVVGKEALRTGSNILGDLVENRSAKESFRDRLQEAGVNLKRKADEKIDSLMVGSGYKRKRQVNRAHSTSRPVKKPSRVRKKSPKIKYTDIFG